MATEPVFRIDAVPVLGEFRLDGPEGRHAATVRRMRVGERLTVTDGRGVRGSGTVAVVERGEVVVIIDDVSADPAPRPTVTLVQALVKGDRGELAVELATEAGVDTIVPWQAARCISRWTGSAEKARRGRTRWADTAAAAAKQSRRTRFPAVADLADTAAVARMVRAADQALLLHESAGPGLREVVRADVDDLLLVVGPEGGLTEDELAVLGAAGARAVRLGPHVLRASTAAAVALGALGVLTGRWDVGDAGDTS